MQLADPRLAALLDGPVTLGGLVALHPGGQIALSGLELANGDAKLTGSATLTGADARADLHAALGDLGRLAPLVPLPLKGGVAADVTGSYAFADGSIAASLDGRTSALDLGPGLGLIGGDGRFAAKLAGRNGNYAISDLSYANAALSLTVPDAQLTPERVTASLRADVTSLAPLAGLVGMPLSGGLGATAKLDYGLADGALTASVEGTTRNISLGSGPALALAGGSGSFSAGVALKDGALTVKDARYDNGIVKLAAGLAPAAGGQELTLDATLDQLGRLLPQLPGPVRVRGTVGMGGGYAVKLDATGPGGISARVDGTLSPAMVPDLAITGTAPLGVANGFLPPDVDVQGALRFDLRLAGQLSPAGLSGRVSASDGRVSIPAAGLALTGMTAQADLSGGRAQVQAATGFTTGGRAELNGTLGLDAPYAIDMKLALHDVGAVKEPTFKTTLNGDLAMGGSVMGTGNLTGRIVLGETEVSLSFDGASGTVIDIQHQGEPAAVHQTRVRAGAAGDGAAGSGGGGGRLNLDLTVSAPNRVFVRGRGLDAELGGELRITGHAGQIIPIGQFDLIRGRLDILGRRLTLSEGSLALQGTFDPVVRLVAATTAEDVNVQIITEGTATAPKVTLNSSPDLPQDEILALLLFGKGLDKISALQALQLANAVRTLLGNGGEGLQGKIRKQFGLDNLDVSTDASGSVAVKAGKYIAKNVYTDVTVNAQGNAEVELNLDISPHLKARGSVGSTGETGLGLFYERDY